MKKLILLIVSLLAAFPTYLFPQISDDFSDGDFIENPAWSGDDSLFVVNEQRQLQLQATSAGNAALVLPNGIEEREMEWRFRIRLAFSPSDNNYARVFLMADSTDLRSPTLSGFFLQFGEAGSNDVIELFYLSENQRNTILRGHASISSAFTYNIKVNKNAQNHWGLWVDTRSSGIYSLDAEGDCLSVAQPVSNRAFGFYCVFTSGNRNKFYLDDVYIGPPIVDTIPPILLSVETDLSASNQLLLTFSEPLAELSALSEQNYQIRETGDFAGLCEFEDDGQKSVRLFFPEDFQQRRTYHLEVNGVRDLSGNQIQVSECEFIFYKLQRNEVLITEIMADPSPPVGLPECEYLEIYNSLPFPIRLKNWKLQLNSTVKNLPEIHLPATGYGLLTSESSASLLGDYVNVMPLSSFSISDEEQKITLLDEKGEVMFYLSYQKSWHQNALKQGGGWALEMLDVHNPCGGKDNWDSSEDVRGGTPSEANSVSSDNPDLLNPVLVKVAVTDSIHLRVFFSEPLAVDTQSLKEAFSLDHGLSVVAAILVAPEFRVVELTLSEPLLPAVIYTLTLNGVVCDCVGNAASSGTFLTFGLPSRPFSNDLIINEVLSNPFQDTDGDFVEIYNVSDKIIDLGNVMMGTGNGDLPDNALPVIADGFQLFPHQYAAICKNRALTMSQYATPNPAALLENVKLPALPNDAGCIHLLTQDFSTIDRFAYDISMHCSSLNSTDGVSLERIHPVGTTQDAMNWTSAAEGYGWATPGYRNSQFSEFAADENTIQVVPDVFSPDGDGYNDFAEVVCNLQESEYRISAVIYNGNGLKIKQLANNEVAAYEVRYRWDGQTEDRRPALNGLYVVQIQIWKADGKTKRYRRSVALTRKS